MLLLSATVVAGLVLLFVGGEFLVRGSSALAIRLGLTPLIVGLTVVAFGTSAPELVVSIEASLAGQSGIAVGNVIGSNALNIGLILGLTALIHPLAVQLQILLIDLPIMIGVTLLAVGLLAFGGLGRIEGALFVGGLLAYVIFSVVYARRVTPSADVEMEFADAVHPPAGSVWRDLFFIGAGFALLVLGSHVLVDGATALARGFNASEAVIGLTIVSFGTSAPELATCVAAALKREPDIALGNVIGSNIFNLLGILGAAAIVAPLGGNEVRSLDLGVLVAFSLVLVLMLWSRRVMRRWEGGILLAGYCLYIATLWPR
jgi:cation:H+ antiporter